MPFVTYFHQTNKTDPKSSQAILNLQQLYAFSSTVSSMSFSGISSIRVCTSCFHTPVECHWWKAIWHPLPSGGLLHNGSPKRKRKSYTTVLYSLGTFMNGQYREFPERITLQWHGTDGGTWLLGRNTQTYLQCWKNIERSRVFCNTAPAGWTWKPTSKKEH